MRSRQYQYCSSILYIISLRFENIIVCVEILGWTTHGCIIVALMVASLPRHIWVMGLGRKYRDMINLMILTKLLKIFELRLDVRRGMGGTWSESRILGTSEDRHYYISPASRASNEDFHNHKEGPSC